MTGAAAAADRFARRLQTFAAGVDGMIPAGNLAAARLVATSVEGFLGAPKVRLQGWGKNGANVGVGIKTASGLGGHTAVLVRMTGPAHILERGAARHMVGTGATGDNHGFRMKIGTDWVTGPFEAGGSPAKHPFEKGVEAARPKIPEVYQRGVESAGRKAFGI